VRDRLTVDQVRELAKTQGLKITGLLYRAQALSDLPPSAVRLALEQLHGNATWFTWLEEARAIAGRSSTSSRAGHTPEVKPQVPVKMPKGTSEPKVVVIATTKGAVVTPAIANRAVPRDVPAPSSEQPAASWARLPTSELHEKCRVCGRPLTNPASAYLGIGTVCLGRQMARQSRRRTKDPVR